MRTSALLLPLVLVGCARTVAVTTDAKSGDTGTALPDTDADADTDSDADADADTDADADADSDSDTDTDADSADADTDTGTSQPPLGIADLAPGDLAITEILKDPDQVDDDLGEWFEVYNTLARTVDLGGLLVRNDAFTQSFTVPGPLLVAPGGRLVFGVEADPALNGGVTVDHVHDPSAFGLNNADDELILDNGSGLVIDEVRYDAGPDWPDPTGRSLSLDPDATSASLNDDGTRWCEATTPFGSGDLGTPGAPNDPC